MTCALRRLRKLRSLSLENTRARARGVGGFPALQELWLLYHPGAPPPAIDLTDLAGLTRLRLLHIKAARLKNPRALARLRALEILSLSETDLGTAVPLANLKKLRILYIGRTKVVDITPLAALRLERLSIKGSRVPSAQIAHLRAKRPRLKIDR